MLSRIAIGDAVDVYFRIRRYLYLGFTVDGELPVGGKSEYTVTSHLLGVLGTVPVGGARIPVGIIICCRLHGIRVMIVTDEVVIIIDVP